MTPYTYEQLKAMKVVELRHIAEGVAHDAVRGYTTMHKEQLIPALCAALGIEAHERHGAVGIDKASIKREIRELKLRRDAALRAGDREEYRSVLRRIHALRRRLRRAVV